MNTIGAEGSAAISGHSAELPGRVDVVVVFPRLAGIVEQDDAAEAVTAGELLQPRRDGLAEEAEDEEFADVINLEASECDVALASLSLIAARQWEAAARELYTGSSPLADDFHRSSWPSKPQVRWELEPQCLLVSARP